MVEGSFAFEHQLISGLIQNRETTETWGRRRKEHEELLNNLSSYPTKMKHQVLAPIGKKAVMKAHLIHTNEILVSLGLGWFVKVSANDAMDICRRRIDECNQILKRCENERALLEKRRDPILRSEAFGGQEIIEKYDENEEKKWREEHKKKVKSHKQRLMDVKDKLKQSTTETEEDLWKHLDMLELQEELEDELTRLGEDSEDTDEEVSYEIEEESQEEDAETCELKDGVTNSKKLITEVHEPHEIPPVAGKSVKLTAIKEEITEHISSAISNTAKSSRPVSKFKKSRQGNTD